MVVTVVALVGSDLRTCSATVDLAGRVVNEGVVAPPLDLSTLSAQASDTRPFVEFNVYG